MSKFDEDEDNPVLLKQLLKELQVCAFVLTKHDGYMKVNVHRFPNDVEFLKRKIRKKVDLIYETTDDNDLKAIVNSIFETVTVSDVIVELAAYNSGQRPLWFYETDDED